MKNLNKILIAGLVIAVIAIVLLFTLVLKNKQSPQAPFQNISSTSSVNENDQRNTNTIPEGSGQYTYEYIADHKAGDQITPENSDGKIYRFDTKTGEKVLMVSSIKSLDKRKENNPYSYFALTAESKDKQSLYFHEAYGEGYGHIFKYDGKINKFSELKISKYFDGFSGLPSEKSPYIISIHNSDGTDSTGNILRLLDLDKDSVKELSKLPSTQTFNICGIEGCLGSEGINAKWLSATQFQIDIYSSTPGKDKDGNPKATLLETRKFTIN